MEKISDERKKEITELIKKQYKIRITIFTPKVNITNDFKLTDYNTAEEWISAAKDWITEA